MEQVAKLPKYDGTRHAIMNLLLHHLLLHIVAFWSLSIELVPPHYYDDVMLSILLGIKAQVFIFNDISRRMLDCSLIVFSSHAFFYIILSIVFGEFFGYLYSKLDEITFVNLLSNGKMSICLRFDQIFIWVTFAKQGVRGECCSVAPSLKYTKVLQEFPILSRDMSHDHVCADFINRFE